MRIGIFTLPLHTNYGGILQAYALQTVLERMGHEVKVINKPLPHASLPVWKWPYSFPKRFIKKYVFGEDVTVFQERKFNQFVQFSRQNTQLFIDKYIHQRISLELKEINEDEFDAFVVGSDQIWRRLYFKMSFGKNCNIANAFLSFTKGWNVKRIAYAASFGKDDISEYLPDEIQACREYIRQFDSISVRECSGVDICKKEFGVNAQWVLDPTMLLSTHDYEALIHDYHNIKDKSLMYYVLDDNNDKENLARRIAHAKGLNIKRANGKVEDPSAPVEEIIQPPVEDWIKGFASSSYVVTDSFHACVFSILFHRQFTVIANKERGVDRFLSLLKIFGLEDRMVFSAKDYKPLPDINYERVDDILIKKRLEAIEFLKNSLS